MNEWLNEKALTRYDGLLLAGLLLAFAVGRASGPVAWWMSVAIAAAVLAGLIYRPIALKKK